MTLEDDIITSYGIGGKEHAFVKTVQSVECSRLLEGDQVKLISERGIEWDRVVGTGTDPLQSFQTSVSAEVRLFYRVEIWRYFVEFDQNLLAAVSNPIYIR